MALERHSDEERDLIDSENTNSLPDESVEENDSTPSEGDNEPGEDMVGDENEPQPEE